MEPGKSFLGYCESDGVKGVKVFGWAFRSRPYLPPPDQVRIRALWSSSLAEADFVGLGVKGIGVQAVGLHLSSSVVDKMLLKGSMRAVPTTYLESQWPRLVGWFP